MRCAAPLLLAACAACHAVLGGYAVDEDGVGGSGDAECTEDVDCALDEGEGCDDGRCARRCLDDDVCPAFTECWAASFCTEPIGTPCDLDDSDSCGGYLCREVDSEAGPVEPYCPGYCNPPEVACPDGFVCRQLSCFREP